MVGPGCNYGDISGSLSVNWMTYWTFFSLILITKPQTTQLLFRSLNPLTFPTLFIMKGFFMEAWHYLIPEYCPFPQWDQQAGPRPHCWGVEQRPHLGHHGGDGLDSSKEYSSIRGGENMDPHTMFGKNWMFVIWVQPEIHPGLENWCFFAFSTVITRS